MSFFIWSTCAVLNGFLALAVLLIMVSGESAYKFVGLGSLIKKGNERPLGIPNAIMFGVFAILVIAGIFCLGAAGNVYVPFARNIFIVTTVLYLLRAAYLLVDPFIKPAAPTFVVMSSYAALAIGATQAFALLYMMVV